MLRQRFQPPMRIIGSGFSIDEGRASKERRRNPAEIQEALGWGRPRKHHRNTNRQETAQSESPPHRTELRRLDGTGSYQTNRDLRKIEVEPHPTADEEGAGEELAMLAVLRSNVEASASR